MTPSAFRAARAVGRVTFLELVRDKILYNILICAILLLGLAILASRLAAIRQDRLVMDFGISAMSVSCVLIALFAGAGLLGREFERRTAFTALARPISRLTFVVGKFLGLAALLAVNWALLSGVFIFILKQATGGYFQDALSATLGWALLLVLAQSLVVAALSVLCSSFTTTSLSATITIGLYLVGSNSSEIRFLAARLNSRAMAVLLQSAATILPDFEYFNLGTKIVYGIPVSFAFVATSLAYAALVIALCLLLAGVLVRRKEG